MKETFNTPLVNQEGRPLNKLAHALRGRGGLSCFERAVELIKSRRGYGIEALRSVLDSYDGLAMSMTLWPWETVGEEDVAWAISNYTYVMLALGVTIEELTVLLEGNPRNRR